LATFGAEGTMAYKHFSDYDWQIGKDEAKSACSFEELFQNAP
jgi:hypothetical protein